MIENQVTIYGVKEALAELGQIDKKARWAAVNQIKASSSGLVAMATETYPSEAELQNQLSGTVHKGRTGYSKTKADRGVRVQVGGRRTRQGSPLVTLVQKDSGAMIYSMAGMRDGRAGKPSGPDRLGRKRQKSQSDAYMRNLQRGFGQGQRGMWKAYSKIYKAAEGDLMDALKQVAASVNRKIVTK